MNHDYSQLKWLLRFPKPPKKGVSIISSLKTQIISYCERERGVILLKI